MYIVLLLLIILVILRIPHTHPKRISYITKIKTGLTPLTTPAKPACAQLRVGETRESIELM